MLNSNDGIIMKKKKVEYIIFRLNVSYIEISF